MTDLSYGTRGPLNAEIVLVGEAWGSSENQQQKPFVGESGRELDRMLVEAGIDPRTVLMTNVVNDKPRNNEMWRHFYGRDELKERGLKPKQALNGLFPNNFVMSELHRLKQQISAYPRRLIIGAGNYPLWALTNAPLTVTSNRDTQYTKVPGGITKYRGSQLRTTDGIPYLPIIHPAAILRQWHWRFYTVHDLQHRVPLAPDKWDPNYRLYILRNEDMLEKAFKLLHQKKRISCDIETKGGIITCIGFGTDAHEAIVLPLVNLEENRTLSPKWDRDQYIYIWKQLRRLLTDPDREIIGQNFMYDQMYINHQFGFKPRLTFDTMIAQHLVLPGYPKDLGTISSLYCTHHAYWKDDNKEWDSKGTMEDHLLYNGEDCCRTFEAAEGLEQTIEAQGLSELWKERMGPHLDMCWEMMERGVKLDLGLRDWMKRKVQEDSRPLEDFLLRIWPQKLVPVKKSRSRWFESPAQLATVFYDQWGLNPQYDGTAVTTNNEALTELEREYPYLGTIFSTVRVLRSMRVLVSNMLSSAVSPQQRMHSSFNITGTETFRFSSSQDPFGRGMNLQNITEGKER